MSTYFSIPTEIGEAKIANALALGIPLKLTHMAVGDGKGATPMPDRKQLGLVSEVRRAPINVLSKDPKNASVLIIEQVLPADVGGWWVREIGIFDEAGDLCAVANCPPSYKPLMNEGAAKDQVLRVALLVASTAAVELKIDPAVVLATRQFVDDAITVYAAPKGHRHAELAPLESPVFSGTPRAPTAADGTSTDQVASTRFVGKALVPLYEAQRNHRHPELAPLESPVFSGTPKVPTAADGTSTDQVASTRFVGAALVPLYEAYRNHRHPDMAPLASPVFTGAPKVPTAEDGSSSDQAASTRFVSKALATATATGMLYVTALPGEKIAEVVFLKDVGMLQWVDIKGSGAYRGYRAPEVGRPEFGSTAAARAYELDLVGGMAPKSAYASLWAWAQQQGVVVAIGAWQARTFAFADVDANYFRLPDLRNVFLRYNGTNVDTGAARAIGSFQDFLNASHSHGGAVGAAGNHYHSGTTDAGGHHAHNLLVGNREGADARAGNGTGGFAWASTEGAGSHTHSFTTGWSSHGDHTHGLTIAASGGAEARPANVAFAPRIHI